MDTETPKVLFSLLAGSAFFCEFVDCSLGMGYGTILTPVLLALGFDPLVCVPAVILSQALGGLAASIFHYRLRNVSYARSSQDLWCVLVISSFGVIAAIFAAWVAFGLSKTIVKIYIGLLVAIMGLFIVRDRPLRFSKNKLIGIALVSAFNKAISGGGFGPVVTGGQILAGYNEKAAVGVTTLAEVPICLAGFLAYLAGHAGKAAAQPLLSLPPRELLALMLNAPLVRWDLIAALTLGAVLVTPFGALLTRRLPHRSLRRIVGGLTVILGLWTLFQAV